MSNPHFIYREVKDKNELFQLLQFRYQGYRDCHLKGFCPENEFGIDLDKYDPYSFHMGLFKVEEGKEIPIGYMRVIQEEEAHMAEVVRKIATSCSPEMLAKVNGERRVVFPVMEYFPESEKSLQQMRGYQIQNRRLCEGSRFIIEPSYRSLRLALFMLEGAFAITKFAWDFTRSIIFCIESNSPIYKSYGYQEFEDIKAKKLERCGSRNAPFLFLFLKKESIPQKVTIKLQKMADAFLQHNAIYFYPDQRGQFHPISGILHPTNSRQIKNAA